MWRLVRKCVRKLMHATSIADGAGKGRKRKTPCADSCRVKRSCVEVACCTEHTVVQLLLQSGHLSGSGLATLCCLSRSFRQACEAEGLWQMACLQRWPSLSCPQADTCIATSGGYRRFYKLRYLPGGELQLNVASNQTPDFMANLLVLLDLSFRGAPVFSRHLAAANFEAVPSKDGISYRLPDITVGAVLQVGVGSTRRSIVHVCRSLHLEGMAFRTSDSAVAHLMGTRSAAYALVGRSMYVTFRDSFILPGVFQVTRLTFEVIVTLVTIPKEVKDDAAPKSPAQEAGDEADKKNLSPEFDVVLGAIGFEVKVDSVSSESRRQNRMNTWQELKWK